MAFDPFGDHETAGYLRNVRGLKNPKHVKQMEHQVFNINLSSTLAWLAEQEEPGYADLLETHRRLFSEFYPWAGQDRTQTSPGKTVHKGPTVFAQPNNIRRAFLAGDAEKSPGKTLGLWAYGHPFLECNGRALFLFLSDRLRRQGLALDWRALDRTSFLTALDTQINVPGGLALDAVMKPHIFQVAKMKTYDGVVTNLANVPWTKQGKTTTTSQVKARR